MSQVRSNRFLAILLTLVMLVQAIAVCGITVGAAEADATPDVVYEESFNSGLWAVEPKTSAVNFDAYKPTAPTVTDGKLFLTEGNSAAFYWKNIPGVKETGTYTLSFDVDITDLGNNNSLHSDAVWKRELNVLLGGVWGVAQFRSCHSATKKIMVSGSTTVAENNYGSDTYSVTAVFDNTVSPAKLTTTVVKGTEINVTKSTTVDVTTAAYAECSPFWVFRCEDGAVKLSNFTFTDGAISISGFEAIGESFLTTEGEGIWTVDPKHESSTVSAYADYQPTAPFAYNGRLYLKRGNAVALWWKEIPEVKAKGIYTLTFDVDVTKPNGTSSSLISASVWKRDLFVALGGEQNAIYFRDDNNRVMPMNSGFTDNNYASDTYSVEIVWNNTVTPNTMRVTATKGDFVASKSNTVDTNASWYADCSPFWIFRCESGAAEVSNLKFSAVNFEEPVSTTEINVPEGKEAIVEADLIYNGAESRMMLGGHELISLEDGKLSMCGSVTAGTYGAGAYHVKARMNPTQKLLITEVTLPEGGTIRRGISVPDTERELLLEVFGENAACVTGASVRYEDIIADDYNVSTEEPVYEGFGANVYNLVTSFTDARYDRAFAWTALESFIGDEAMALKYRAVGESAWTVVDAAREVETLSDVENYFEADITGLTENTRYEYKIGKANSADEENDWSCSYYFTTAKENVGDFSFIALGDNQGHSWDGSVSSNKGYMYTQTAITQALSKLSNPAFILNTGDMTETNAPAEWNMYFHALGGSVTEIPHFATIGGGKHDNHDFFDMHFNHPNNGGKDAYTNVNNILNATPTGEAIVNYLDETVYSFNYGDAHFVVVDAGAMGHANSRILMQEQREWLAADLEANKDAKWKIVMTHQPTYSNGAANNDRDFLADIIENYGVDLVLHGHEHQVARTYPMKDGQIVTKEITDTIEKGVGTIYTTIGPTTVNHDSGPANPNREHMMTIITNDNLLPCYTVVDVKADGLTVTVRQADGLVLDTYTIVSAAEAPEEEPDVEIPGYGFVPAEYSNASKYPLVAFVNGEFVGAATSWSKIGTVAGDTLKANNGATVTVLLRDNVATDAPIYFYNMNGTVLFDLGEHTITVNHTLLRGTVTATYDGEYATNVIVKNGALVMDGSYIFFTQNKQTQGADKVFHFTFEGVTIKKGAYTGGQTFYAGDNDNPTKNNIFNFTFNDCTFDFSDNAAACNLFRFNRDKVSADIKINGGSIVAPASAHQLTVSNLDSASSLTFGKGSNGEYTTLSLPEGVDTVTDRLNTNSFETTDGKKVEFVKRGDVYKLASAELKITGAYLNLTDNINVLYSANIPTGYENPYMVFEYNGESYTVSKYTVAEDGEWLFAFEGVTPQMVGESIKATLYATKDGVEVSVEKAEYSVLTYCKNMLSKTTDAKLKTLLSDLLVYAAASQTYMDYKTDALVTEGLSLTPSTFAPLASTDKALHGTEDARVEWKGAALRYENAMAMKFNFKADKALTLKITVGERSEIYTSDDWETDENGNYVVYFRGILATEYDDVVTAVLYENDAQVGEIVTYSVNSYVYSMQNEGGTLGALVQATYNYGASAENYN